jgi:hypothetical protein
MPLSQSIPSFAPAPQQPSVVNDYLSSVQSVLVPQVAGDSFRIASDLAAFVFDYIGEIRDEMHSEITDHYTENNAVINDHIALRPVRITARGFVAELAQTSAQLQSIFATLQSSLTAVQAYLGQYTPQAFQVIQRAVSQAQNVENEINVAVAQGKNVLNLFQNSAPAKTRQQQAYATLKGYREARVLFNVVTPWDTYKNMAVETIIISSPEDTKTMSDISVTLKQLRFTEVLAITNPRGIFAARAAFANQTRLDQGKTPGTRVDASVAYSVWNSGK